MHPSAHISGGNGDVEPTKPAPPIKSADALGQEASKQATQPGFWAHHLASKHADRAESTPSPLGNQVNQAKSSGSTGTLQAVPGTAAQPGSSENLAVTSNLLRTPPGAGDEPGKQTLAPQRLFKSPMPPPPPPLQNYNHGQQQPQPYYYVPGIDNMGGSGDQGGFRLPSPAYNPQPDRPYDLADRHAPFGTAANMGMAPVYNPSPRYHAQQHPTMQHFQYPPIGVQQALLPTEPWVPPSPVASPTRAPGELAAPGRSMPEMSSLGFDNCSMCGDASVQGMIDRQNPACFMCIPCWNVVTSRSGIKRASAAWTQGFRDKFKSLHRLQGVEVSVTTANNRFTIQVNLLENFLIKFCDYQKIDLGSVGGDGGDIQSIFTAMRLGRAAFLLSATFNEHVGAAAVNNLIHDQQVVVNGRGSLHLAAAIQHSTTCLAICAVASASAMGLVEVY